MFISALALLPLAHARAADWPTASLVYTHNGNELSNRIFPVTRENGFASRQDTLGLTLEGELQGITWRTRALLTRDNANPRQRELRLKELNKVFVLGERCTASLGKRILAWDVGFLLQPVGFFQTQPTLTDLRDQAGNSEGLPLAMLSCQIQAGSAIDLVHSRDSAEIDYGNRGLQQSLLRISGQNGQLSYGVLARQVNRGGHGVGATLSFTPGESIEVHGSVYSHKGGRGKNHLGLNQAAQFYFADPYQESVDDGWRSKWLLGVTATPRDWPSFTLEWSHNGQGWDKANWQRWRDLVDFHRQAPATDGLRNANLFWDLQSVNSQGMLHDYLYLQIQDKIAGFDVSLGQILGLADHSHAVFLSLDHQINRRHSINFSLRHFVRKSGTEYDYLPYPTSFGIRFASVF